MPPVLPEARCRVCREALTATGAHEPWCLACGHTVCAACRALCTVQRIANTNTNTNDSPVMCPLCHVTTDVPPCRNHQMAELLAALAALPTPPAPVPVPVPAPVPAPAAPLSVPLVPVAPAPRPGAAPPTLGRLLAALQPPPPPPWVSKPAAESAGFLPQLNTPSAPARRVRVLRQRVRHSAPPSCPAELLPPCVDNADQLLRQESSCKVRRRD